MRRERPDLVAHADWSVAAGKRWIAVARLGRCYTVAAPRLVGDPERLLDALLAEAGPGGRVFLGFDFPIGLPRHYAAKAGIASTLDLLSRLGQGEWRDFYDVAGKPEEISLRRPFYPMHPSGPRRPALAELLSGLGLAGRDEILRHCDRGPPAAAPIFWTVGPNQVGKAALVGWRTAVAPALARKRGEVGIWPFDGPLEELLATRRVVLAETYPGEIYGHLGVTFARGLAPPSGKRVQRDRRSNAAALLGWAARAGVALSPELADLIRDGFGPSPAGDDPFDATVGVLGMLNVLLGHRPTGEPDAPAIRSLEGWILGRSAARGLGLEGVARSVRGFELHPQLAAETVEVCRLGLSRVLLSRDSSHPWIVLVPERAGVREIVELSKADRARLMEDIARASAAMATLFAPDKLNVAALGNTVAQLHVHVVARYRTDRAWPRPIWGAGPPVPYAPGRLEERRARLRAALIEDPSPRRARAVP